MATPFVDVLVPVALDHTYSYRVPRELSLAPGDIVAVPLGAREVMGVVWADDVTIKPGLHNRMKDVAGKFDYPPLRAELRRFVDWVSGYTL
ncbi:MAG: primosomal protein N', partial [Rhizobiales bacterium]|nr:primosomal protein N' [Hyphomicrobiales bacterium]